MYLALVLFSFIVFLVGGYVFIYNTDYQNDGDKFVIHLTVLVFLSVVLSLMWFISLPAVVLIGGGLYLKVKKENPQASFIKVIMDAVNDIKFS